jgi:signal transduction histidine kinase
LHPDDQALLRDLLSKPQAQNGFEVEYRVLRPDGSVRWVLDRGFPVKDRAGVVCRFAGIARDITERKELEREVLGISERERQRIGQDLHDDLCQQLVGLEFLSQALQQQLSGRPEASKAAEIARLIRGAIDHTRRLARGLAPVDLEAEGLVPALRGLARRASKSFGLKCSVLCPESIPIPDLSVSTHLYRIAQEAVTNSVKHGQARRIQIRLAATDARVCLSIHDNGSGLARGWRQRRGMGLRIMQYRASTLGGTCVIQPEPNGGTTLRCTIPMSIPERTVPGRP